jgi:hypothetical protein
VKVTSIARAEEFYILAVFETSREILNLPIEWVTIVQELLYRLPSMVFQNAPQVDVRISGFELGSRFIPHIYRLNPLASDPDALVLPLPRLGRQIFKVNNKIWHS